MDERNRRSAAGTYLVVMLAHEEWGLPLACVRECVAVPAATTMAGATTAASGHAAHGRYRDLPVADLRVRLGLPQDALTDRARLLIADVTNDQGARTAVALLVDAVVDVVDLTADDLADVAGAADAAETTCMRGFARGTRHMTLLTDPGALVTSCRELAHAA